MRSELVVGADERAQPLGVVGQRLEGHAIGHLADLDPALSDRGHRGRVDLEHGPFGHGRGLTPDMAVRGGEGVRVEAGQVGEAPGLHGRVRKRKGLVALEERGAISHSTAVRSGGAA